MEKLYRKKRKPSGYSKRSEEQRAYDVRFCTDLFLRGYSYREISDALNQDLSDRGIGYTISFQMVYYDLQQCLIEWKRERLETIDEYITQELRKLDKMEQQAWAGWETSKAKKYRKKKKPKTGATECTPEYYEYVETAAGNPRFLDLLLNIQQRRAKLLGLDAPVKINIPGGNAGTDDDKPKYDIKAIPDDLLFTVVDKLQSAEFQKIIDEKGGTQ